LFGRRDFAAKAGAIDGKTLALLGAGSAHQFAKLRERDRTAFKPRVQFPDTGYYLLGTSFETPDEIRLLVDCGPLGYLSLAAHGHADALSFVLNVGDREILVDPGTYAYHTEPEWRRYFRSTAAHNTVCIDGEDQSVQAGNFMWTHHAHAACLKIEMSPRLQRFIGEHDGYRRLPDPVVHRREISFRPDQQCFDVIDTLRCRHTHTATRHWHFAPDCQVDSHGAGLRVTSGVAQVFLEPMEALQHVANYRGGTAAQGGWVSRALGRRQLATTVSWQSRVAGNTVLRSRIRYMRSRHGAA
jgi:hypothetical protein